MGPLLSGAHEVHPKDRGAAMAENWRLSVRKRVCSCGSCVNFSVPFKIFSSTSPPNGLKKVEWDASKLFQAEGLGKGAELAVAILGAASYQRRVARPRRRTIGHRDVVALANAAYVACR